MVRAGDVKFRHVRDLFGMDDDLGKIPFEVLQDCDSLCGTIRRVNAKPEHLHEPVLKYARKDFPLLGNDWTVERALQVIRREGVGERIIYFYVVNERGQLAGVLPTRRLLTALPDVRLKDLMISRLVTIPRTATVLEACEMFVLHKFLAFPVVDHEGHLEGVVDVTLLTEEVFDIAEREQMEGVFEAIGFRASQVRDASPWKAFRYRFRGCWRRLAAARFAQCSRASSRRHWLKASSSPFSSRSCWLWVKASASSP
jgi:Mg/Co/Ni transporter MgtE